MGWTGGQFSVLRVLLALALMTLLIGVAVSPSETEISHGLRAFLLATTLAAGAALVIGWRERLATALLLLLLVGFIGPMQGAPIVAPEVSVVLATLLLGFYTAIAWRSIPPAPFGSWEARDRPDPRGDWSIPNWMPQIAWLAVAALALIDALHPEFGLLFHRTASNIDAIGSGALRLGVEVLFLVAVFGARYRKLAWSALALSRLVWLFVYGAADAEVFVWLLMLLAFEPGWVRPRTRVGASTATEEPARLFYDGECGLCHGAIRFILAEESPVHRFRFAPLGSDTWHRVVGAHSEIRVEELPDSLVVVREDGRVLTRAGAVIEIAGRLGGLWGVLAFVGRVLPERALDAAYDGVARIRKRIFATPKDACPILPPALRERFEF